MPYCIVQLELSWPQLTFNTNGAVKFIVPCILHQRDEVTGEWRKLRNEELKDLYCSPNIVQVIKSRRIKWEGHVARIRGEERCIQGFDEET